MANMKAAVFIEPGRIVLEPAAAWKP